MKGSLSVVFADGQRLASISGFLRVLRGETLALHPS
jgi:hypothetical protein